MLVPRVVVVEDEPAIRFALGELLMEEGSAVDAVAGGADALRLLATGAPVDAMLIDLFMPGMTGRDLVHAIRAGGRHADVPILLLTGAVYRAEDHPAPDAYPSVIEKPFDVDTVGAALRRVTGAVRADSA